MAGTLAVDTLTISGQTGNAVSGIAKAWVNFNGVNAVTVKGSYNVGSVTRRSAGKYVVNFATPMPDLNYACLVTGGSYSDSTQGYISSEGHDDTTMAAGRFASSVQVRTTNPSSSQDAVILSVAIFR